MLAEFAAVKAALGVGVLSGKVYDTARLDTSGSLVRDAYAVLFGGIPAAVEDPRFSRDQQPGDGWSYLYTVRAIAPDPDGVRAVMNVAFTNLIGKRLTVAGRSLSAIDFENATDPRDDDSVTPPMYFADLDVNLTSLPA